MTFTDTEEGTTRFCTHTTDNSICDKCLGREEVKIIKMIEQIDAERRQKLGLIGDLRDLSYWLDNGYREDNNAKGVILDLIEREIERLKREAEDMLQEIFKLKETK